MPASRRSPCLLRPFYFFLAFGLYVALAACQPRVTVDLVPVQAITVPTGYYSSVTWLAEDQLVVNYRSDSLVSDHNNSLWSLSIDAADLRVLDLPLDESVQCIGVFFLYAERLADGRLAFERLCYKLGLDGVDRHLLYWDPATDTGGLLYDYELPVIGPITLAPDMSRGLMSSMTFIADHLYWLDATGAQAIDLGMDRARLPAWSPDGAQIAFVGRENLWGAPGPAWGAQSDELWLISADCESLPDGCAKNRQLLLSNIYDAIGLQWSPDGQWLAIDGAVANAGKGVYLLSLKSGSLLKVLDGDYVTPNWSPDGQHIVVLGPADQNNHSYRSSLHLLDVSAAIMSAAP